MGPTGIRRRVVLVVALAMIAGGTAYALAEWNANPSPARAASPVPAPLAEPRWMKPSMGWNSWNHFACGIDEWLIRGIADAMVSRGLQAAGYDVVALDACWSARERNGAGDLTHNPQTFPSGMKALGDYIHSKGLRFGIYASIGYRMCQDVGPGSLDHEFRDVATFASWGVDYIKADRCSAEGLVMKDLYARWRDAIAASGRPIVLSASDNMAIQEPWSWGPVTAHQWRMSGDIIDAWTTPPYAESWQIGMIDIFDRNAAHAAATAPGTYNDPDMLEVGNGGMTETEYRTHFGLWALMSAPLLAGNDLRSMSEATRAILTHPEAIAIDQDPLAFQATPAHGSGGDLQVWYKPLNESGARAVGLLNRGPSAATITVSWTSIGLRPGPATVRDVWDRADRGTFVDSYAVSVPSHGLALLRVVGSEATLWDGFLSDQPWTYAANEFGPVERDASNGEAGAGDGGPIRLNGVTYAKGFGVHAPSALEFRSDGTCSTLTADIGVDDEVGNQGSVIFQVWGDGRLLFESGTMNGWMPAQSLSVDVTGRRSLRLQVVAVDSAGSDHADWANVRIVCGAAAPPPADRRPQASFTATPSLVPLGASVAFDASASTDPDGTIVSYAWDFGDGSVGQGMRVDHAFQGTGRFAVALTVADDGGNSATATVDVVVDDPPVARFTATPADAMPGTMIRFDGSGSRDSDGTIVSYTWDFGDGRTALGSSVSHAYARRGAFLVRLEVMDDLGVKNGTTMPIDIANRGPVILNATPATQVALEASDATILAVVATDPDGDGLRYAWAVDGKSAGSAASSYRFVAAAAGTYLVEVVVGDGVVSTKHTWSVVVRGPPEAARPPFGLGWMLTPVGLAAMAGIGAALVAVAAAARHRRG